MQSATLLSDWYEFVSGHLSIEHWHLESGVI
jgi:hypothetical protein